MSGGGGGGGFGGSFSYAPSSSEGSPRPSPVAGLTEAGMATAGACPQKPPCGQQAAQPAAFAAQVLHWLFCVPRALANHRHYADQGGHHRRESRPAVLRLVGPSATRQWDIRFQPLASPPNLPMARFNPQAEEVSAD